MMYRLRTMATVFFMVLVPSLFVYYLYYDSLLTIVPRYQQPTTTTTLSINRLNNNNGEKPAAITVVANYDSHKYAKVWHHRQQQPIDANRSIFVNQANNHFNQILDNELDSKLTDLASSPTSSSSSPKFVVISSPPRIPPANLTADPSMEIENRRRFIKKMMKNAWNSYVRYAWGYNELQPQTRNAKKDSIFGSSKIGLTIVDSLDTLLVMNMRDEFEAGRRWVSEQLNFKSIEHEISVFETIIRYVGGLLSCYALTGDMMFLNKSLEVAESLLPAYDTQTGIPNGLIIPKSGKNYHHSWAYGAILSEFGSHHLEFTYLTDMSGDRRFRDRIMKIRDFVNKIEKRNGLYLLILDNMVGQWSDNRVSLGALGDSFFEYLIKSYVQSDHSDKQALRMYVEAMDAIDQSGMLNISRGGLTYVSDLMFGKPTQKMQHLACFAPGMYMLGAHHMAKDVNRSNQSIISMFSSSNDNNSRSKNERISRHYELALNLTETCFQSYHRTPTRLGPESFYFDEENDATNKNGDYYILRPETIESYFIMWRMTKDNRYREYAWEAAQAIHQHCLVESGGYAGLYNVMKTMPTQDNTQQSFFLAETLKYLYLIFSNDQLLPLDQWVFNTEAHPLPICGRNPAYPKPTCNRPLA